MKIVTVIGARPQIIKASAISRAIRDCFADKIDEVIVHTGQHYDRNMSEVFFSELEIPRPKHNLAVGSGKHGEQTAKMIERLEAVFEEERPHAVVLYGDTNSTLAGAVAASKMSIPIVHVEAGLRSFDKSMPEEVNRIVCDHLSTLLFSPTQSGYDNLIKEGFSTRLHEKADANHPNIYHCGDIMYDNTLYFSQKILDTEQRLKCFGENFVLCTIHRNNNTDDGARLKSILEALHEISKFKKIILPMHPRTRKMIPAVLGDDFMRKLNENENIRVMEPVSFSDMIYLEKNACLVLTDSGGVQKEAYFLKKPAIILRPQTEWVEIVQCGNAAVCDANRDLIVNKAKDYILNPPADFPELFGNGKAGRFICETMLKTL